MRCIQQRALGAPRQLAEARGEKGAQGHGARVFAAAFASARIFFLWQGGALGCQWAFHAVGAGWARVQRPRRATKRAPTRKLKGGASELTFDGRRHLRAKKKGRWHGRIM